MELCFSPSYEGYPLPLPSYRKGPIYLTSLSLSKFCRMLVAPLTNSYFGFSCFFLLGELRNNIVISNIYLKQIYSFYFRNSVHPNQFQLIFLPFLII